MFLKMSLCVFLTVFLIASCWAKSSPSYRSACEAVVKQINEQKMKKETYVFDMISPEELTVGSQTFTFQVKDTSFTSSDENGLYVSEEICDSTRLSADSHIIRFLMKMGFHTVNGRLMVQEEKNGKWLEKTFTSHAFNGTTWEVELQVDNKWNVQQLKYLNWTNDRWSQKYETALSDCPLEKTAIGDFCYYFLDALSARLSDIFQERLKATIEAVINKIKGNNMPQVEDEGEMEIIDMSTSNETAKVCACGDRDVMRGSNYGWVMDVQTVDKSGVSGQCLSSLISDRHILTARDCVVGKKLTVKLDSKTLAVKRILGIRGPGQNLAVIQLSEPLKFSSSIVPVCLETIDYSEEQNMGKELLNPVDSKYAYRLMTKLAGFDVTPQTHLLIENLDKDRCPKLPYTQLYSVIEETEYVVGVLHTENSKNFCQTREIDIALFDRLSVYKTLFETLLKDAKTCPPKKKPEVWNA